MGFLSSKDTSVSYSAPIISSYRVQTSAYAKPKALIYGRNRVTPNLMWFGDFRSIAHTETQSSGGKGGGETTTSNTTYTYEAAALLALGEGPIQGVLKSWKGKQVVQASTAVPPKTFTTTQRGQVPSGAGHQITVDNAGSYLSNVKVVNSSWQWNVAGSAAGLVLRDVSPNAPAAFGEYKVVSGVYTFANASSNLLVDITYNFGTSGYTRTSLARLGMSLFLGNYSQSAWGYLTSHHPSQALTYRGVAYVATSALDLGSNASMDNYSFEVDGLLHFGSLPDANPKDVLVDLLTNPHYGAVPVAPFGFGDLDAYSDYCVANDLLVSPVYDDQAAAVELVKQLLAVTNSAGYYSEGVLKVTPLGDASASAHGTTYTPNLTPAYDLTLDDFLVESPDDDPVRVTRGTTADAYNSVKVKFYDRAGDYNEAVAEAMDQANIELYGLRPMDPVDAKQVAVASTARTVAQLLLQRALYIRNIYEFRLGWMYALLEPTDLVTLTDPYMGLDRKLVRILEIEENEYGDLSVKAEDMLVGVAGAAAYDTQTGDGYLEDHNVDPGDTNPPAIFDAPGALTVTGYEAWIAASGGEHWGGCEVWVGTDPSSYKKVGVINGRARHGVLSAPLAFSASDPDETDTLSVDLSLALGELTSGTTQDADAYLTLCLVGTELVSYRDATLTGTGLYDLDYLRRGAYNSPVQAHDADETFVRLDQAVFRYAYEPSFLNRPIYVKLPAFNVYGAAKQSLADVTEYQFVPTGSLTRPSTVEGFTAGQNGAQVVCQWTPVPDLNVRGYELRYAAQGATSWADATVAATDVSGNQLNVSTIPPGSWTLMIRAKDTSGNYSPESAFADVGITDGYTVLAQSQHAPDWLDGTMTNMLLHWTGVLVPTDQQTAAYYGWDTFDQFVPTPYATSYWEAPEVDLGSDGTQRVHADIASALGPGAPGVASPGLEVRGKLSAGSYGPWQPWTTGTLTARYVQARVAVASSVGVPYVSGFQDTVDALPFTQDDTGVTVPTGGLTVTFPLSFRTPPATPQVVATDSSIAPAVSAITETGFHVVFPGASGDVHINWSATGV